MPSLYTLTSGALASSQDINQLVLTLTAQQNTPVSIKNTDPIAFTLQLQNTDPAGKTLLIYGPDGTTVLNRVQGNGVVASPDGTAAAPIVTTTHAQTLTNKTFTAPHFTAPVVDSGGLTVTAGGLTVAGGGIALQAGNMTLTTGQAIANGIAYFRAKDLGSVANAAAVVVDDTAAALGILFVIYGGGAVAGYALNGGAHTTTLLFGPGAIFTTTFNNANTVNVYWNTSDYFLQNNTGGANTFRTFLFSNG